MDPRKIETRSLGDSWVEGGILAGIPALCGVTIIYGGYCKLVRRARSKALPGDEGLGSGKMGVKVIGSPCSVRYRKKGGRGILAQSNKPQKRGRREMLFSDEGTREWRKDKRKGVYGCQANKTAAIRVDSGGKP